MWYGKEASDDLKGEKMEEFLSVVEGGHLSDLGGLTTPTSNRWATLISGCWERRPQKEKASQIVSQWEVNGKSSKSMGILASQR